ncbi:hypothetical protein [Campylobacter armoricus]|uniref:hypothetical protein n=1 Tax=Campylobacter armoricus TaxID=2505970 RepID=UPI001117A7DD|nr:hypothetical protein [Campylobacter armoricus]
MKNKEKLKYKKEFIDKNYKKAYTSLELFFDDFLDKLETNSRDETEDRKKEKQRLKKALERGNSEKDINVLYEFLLEHEEIKKLDSYKPLFDDEFERKILGDKYDEIVKNLNLTTFCNF